MNVSAGKKARACAAKGEALRLPCARCVFDGKLKTWQKRGLEFLIGGVGYGMVELLWRAETHWSMVITGGVCLIAICAVNRKMAKKNIFLRAGACAAAITATEFAVGMLVNRLWGMDVWSYDEMFGNVLGQICPLYSFLWFLLSLPICAVVGRMACRGGTPKGKKGAGE